MRKDFVFSLRTLRRSPVFTSVAVLSLALGIGANTAIFSLLQQVVLRLLPVRQPERLVLLHTDYNAPGSSMSDNSESVFSNPMYRRLRDNDPAFSDTIARAGAQVSVEYGGSTDVAAAEIVSGNFFTGLGVQAALGRVLLPQDDRAPGANPVVVLGHGFWSRRFGASREVLNRKIVVMGQPMVVVGVAAASFNGVMPGSTPDLYVPVAMKRAVTPTWDGLEDPRTRWLDIFGRIKPGLTLEQAQAATRVVYRSALESELAKMGRMRTERDRNQFLNHRLDLRPAAQGINELRREWERPLEALMGMVGMVLLIACANVAGLMLARAGGRRREIAIRLAMGAGRGALVRQLLVEGLILASAGGALALLVASWSTDALIRLLPGGYAGNWLSPAIDFPLLAFTAALAVLSGLAFALIPALQATRPDVADTLKNQAASTTATRGAARFRRVMVSAQVALSMLLLAGAGLFTTSLARLLKVDLGFRTEHVMTFSLDARMGRPALNNAIAFYREFQQRLSAAGDVSAVAAADNGPFSNSNRGSNLTIEGYEPREDEGVGSSIVGVSPGFFHAMGVPLRAGRDIDERDTASAPKVVVINEAFARRYFAGRNPLGRRLMFGASNHPVLDREIVGVAADFRNDVRNPAKEALFMPYEQWDSPQGLMFYVRAAGSEERLAGAVRRLARSLDAGIPVRDVKPLDVEIGESIYADRLIAMLSLAFAAVATLLAVIGLYGVVAYGVSRRTPEIGVRIALGAVPGDVIRMVLLDAAQTVGIGIAAGLAAAFALTRYLQSQLFGVKGSDPLVLLGAACVLAVVAMGAALVPGRRASRIDPLAALKYE
jgi:predicted permease